MKNLMKLFAAIVLTMSTMFAVEAKPKAELVTSTFEVDIDCESCVKKIMNVLPYQRGVKSVDVKLSNKSVAVKYDPSKSSDEAIVGTLKRVDIKATKRKLSECSDCDCEGDRR